MKKTSTMIICANWSKKAVTYLLVTNDDGVSAPGLFALAQAMREIGDIEVIAPEK